MNTYVTYMVEQLNFLILMILTVYPEVRSIRCFNGARLVMPCYYRTILPPYSCLIMTTKQCALFVFRCKFLDLLVKLPFEYVAMDYF